MAFRNTDFHRNGRPLGDWLLDLVSENRGVRRPAGEALVSMWYGFPEGCWWIDQVPDEFLLHHDFVSATSRFDEAVRTATVADGFPTARFVEGLVGLRIRLSGDGARDHRNFVDVEDSTPVGFATFCIFKALDVTLLASPNALRALLECDPERHKAYDALTRIGPPAVAFASRLLEWLDTGEIMRCSEVPRPLGRIGRGDPIIVSQILDRIDYPDENIAWAAIVTLGHMGPELAGRNEEAVGRLLAMEDDQVRCMTALDALSRIAPTDERVLGFVLRKLAPRPPKIEITQYNSFRDETDLVMHERGVAIEAAGRMTAFPEQVIPALVDAFNTFVEYDSDMEHFGEQARVAWGLKPFGPAAASAVPILVRFLNPCNERPRAVLELIAAIGPAAVPLLPYLWEIRGDTETPLDPNDTLDAAIQAVRGADPQALPIC